jgi:hypothetical protein
MATGDPICPIHGMTPCGCTPESLFAASEGGGGVITYPTDSHPIGLRTYSYGPTDSPRTYEAIGAFEVGDATAMGGRAERARIVAWIRAHVALCGGRELDSVADAIERGEHEEPAP